MGSETGDEITLSDLQLAVMRVLWERGEASTAEVVDTLAAERGLAHTTVATVLSRLERRALVGARRDGRQLVYRACVSEPQVRRSMVAGLIDSLFRGDAKALMSHLVSEDAIAPSDLETLRKLIDKAGKNHV